MSIVSKEEYWTTILNDYSQFDQITTEDSEFNSIANDVWNVLENSFIKIDDEESIIKWEEMTGLSGEGLTIFQRKVNILYTLTVKNYLPISLFTQAMDRLVGKDNYFITFNEDTQKYEVECYEDYETSASFLNKRLANESVEIEIYPFLGSDLPSGYLAAEFLESTGTQYINTNICGKNSSSVFLSYTQTIADDWSVIFGARTVKGVNELSIIIKGATSNGISCTSGKRKVSLPSVDLNKRYEITITPTFGRISSVDDLVENIFENDDTYITAKPCYLFAYIVGKEIPECMVHARVYGIEMLDGIKQELKFIPALDPTGTPCMYDVVTRKPFYNSGTGSFIVGMDMKQAVELSKLPSIGGTLTVSLPSNYTEDEDVVNSLSTAQGNGWVITIQTYETEANAASTFALRRVWVRKTQNEQGSYVDSDGSRWQVDWCVDIVGSSPEAEGYELFRSVDTAIEYWGLTTWIDPEQEELLINDFTEND